MSNWYDSEMEVLRRHDRGHEMSRTRPLSLPGDRHDQPSLLHRLLNWLSREPQPEPTRGRERKPVLRTGS